MLKRLIDTAVPALFGAFLLAFCVAVWSASSCEPKEEQQNGNTKKTAIQISCKSFNVVSIQLIGINAARHPNELGVGITAIATIFIAYFTFTLKGATDKLWNAGERQLTHLEETAARQLRAYVSVQPAMLGDISPEKPPFFAFVERNNGLTPAYSVVHAGVIDLFPYPLPDDFPFPRPAAPVIGSRITLYPDVNPPPRGNIVAKRKFTKDEWIEIFSAQSARRLYVFGELTYRDSFKKNRWTRFGFRFSGAPNYVQFIRADNWAQIDLISRSIGLLTFESTNQHNETEDG
jgi:hypothetical protein